MKNLKNGDKGVGQMLCHPERVAIPILFPQAASIYNFSFPRTLGNLREKANTICALGKSNFVCYISISSFIFFDFLLYDLKIFIF